MDKQEPKVEDYSILNWIFKNGVVSEKGEPLDFKDHPFLLDILSDWSKTIVVKACAQVGKSVTFNYKALFACKMFRWNIIYTMPTDGDVREFVATKTNRIIMANRNVFKDVQTDNIERKDISGRSIFFKGTVSKSAAISTSADLLIHDEASRSDQEALHTYKSRTKDSKYKGRWLFSNPTTERDVLDQEWQKSDQKEWCITCPHCKDEHYLNFPDSFDLIKKCFICKNCKEPISDDVRRRGKWIAQNPGSDISGYHLSHLIATKISAKEIIEDSEGDQEYFHNFVLGEPYNPGDLTVSRTTILDLWTPKELETGNYFLGVDVGNIKHYVLGSEKGIIKVGKFTEWQVLDDMMKHYKPKLVIDALPDSTMSKYFVKTYRNALMWYPMENANNPQLVVWYGENDKKGIIYSHRDRSIDMMIDDMVQAKFLIGVPSNKEFIDYIKHFETLRRVKETNVKGIERYVWESTTNVDHYCFKGDTLVLTNKGNKKIKDIKVGEYVLTRKGYKRVIHSGITKRNAKVVEATFDNGTKIISTPEHPFYVKGFGMKPLCDLLCNDILLVCKQQNKGKENILLTKELNLEDTLMQKEELKEFISYQVEYLNQKVLEDCTKRYGRIKMEKYQKTLLYTIETITHLIMNYLIWNVLKGVYINRNTLKEIGKTKSLEKTKLKELEKKLHIGLKNLKSGLEQKNGKSISRNIQKILLQELSLFVLNVESHLYQKVRMVVNSVEKSVVVGGMQENGEENTQTTKLNTLKPVKKRETVYNLCVEDEHEYYANGILVSNCFATLYYRLAVASQNNGQFLPDTPKPYQIISDDNKVGDFSKYFDNLKYTK